MLTRDSAHFIFTLQMSNAGTDLGGKKNKKKQPTTLPPKNLRIRNAKLYHAEKSWKAQSICKTIGLKTAMHADFRQVPSLLF